MVFATSYNAKMEDSYKSGQSKCNKKVSVMNKCIRTYRTHNVFEMRDQEAYQMNLHIRKARKIIGHIKQSCKNSWYNLAYPS